MSENQDNTRFKRAVCAALFGLASVSAPALAQTGVDDDRVSLPEGPGSIEGVGENVEIDPNMGSMSYAVNIIAPQGQNGLTPAVGLNYSSSAGSSVVGVGWSMPSMTIERMTARGTPEYKPDDVFAANGGDELVLVEEAGDKQVYRQRFEGAFIRYTWHDVGVGEDGYWTAEYPDGAIAYFGADADGNIVESARSMNPDGGTYKYHMVERQDAYGHAIVYTYETFDGNWPLVSNISYVFESGQPVYQIDYDYEQRQDLISDAGAGYEELLEYRLTHIGVQSREELIREYVLSYEQYEDAGGFSRLMNVKRYGVGGEDAGELYPIEFTFGYSNALGVTCTAEDCDKPYLVDMGQTAGASGLTSGKATLVDINADGLPDVLDTSEQTAHKFLINQLTPNAAGGFDHAFLDPVESSIGTGGVFGLGDNITQTLDINGDGLSDLVNTSTGATLVAGYGFTDWAMQGASLDVNTLRSIDIQDARFMDYNNDKLIDVITSTAQSTTIYENTGDEFVARNIDPIGVQLSGTQTVQLADMNGDGYNDVVEILGDGSMRYRVNFGWGKWSGWRSISGLNISTSERELVDLEDLNGDGLSDVVIVTATEVKYAINRNGDNFDDFEKITSADISGNIPERQLGDKVLYADMNANGSEDIVWFTSQGSVQYLELFPVRPNLLARVENGVGMVQKISYTTSAEQEAIARSEGNPWGSSLSVPMNIVAGSDIYVTLTGNEDGTGLHELVSYRYRDGFYDGVEKQFRGFEDVEITVMESDSQEGGKTIMKYSVGRDEPHMNGLLLEQTSYTGERAINTQTSTYETCALDAIPGEQELVAAGRFPVKFPCKTARSTVVMEGAASESDWVTTRATYAYDGYGNTTEMTDEGIVGVDGDEQYDTTTFYNTTGDGRWLIGLPLLETASGLADGSVRNETTYYYDGADFVGTQSELTHGFLSRKTVKVDDSRTIDVLRQRRDLHGNSIETIDPNGSIEDDSKHRRLYYYDSLGMFLTYLDIKIDADHTLRRSTQYEYAFQNMTEATDWVLVKGGEEVSGRNTKRYAYDDFGRIIAEFKPGDDSDKPTFEYEYELSEPFSRIISKARSERNGELDEFSYQCFDGRGQAYQGRNLTAQGSYLVTGFTVYNSRGAAVEEFQPYTSDTADCESARPAGVLSTLTRYDAADRVIEESIPGEDIYGERLVTRTTYEPFKTVVYDHEDLNEESAHYNTPTITYRDGLERVVAIERVLDQTQAARYELFYDETNTFSGYTDPGNNRHELVVDLASRVTAVRNPSFGEFTFEYDDAGNITAQTDSRGVSTSYEYDGGNRLVRQWDTSDKDATLISFIYDERPDTCALVECTNVANRLAMVTYPTPFGVGADRFGYDARQRVVFQGRSFGEFADLTTKTTYSNVNRVSKYEYSDGTVVEPEFDQLGRTVGVKGFIDDITYSDRGLIDTISFANGASSEHRHDALMRLESKINRDATSQAIEGLLFERDRIGNILTIEDMSDVEGPGYQSSFVYDAWYRVVTSTQETDGEDETMTYDFDLLDRVTAAVSSLADSDAHVGSYEYESERPLLVERAGEIVTSFDSAGHLTSRDGLTLEWDHLARISKVARGSEVEQHVYGYDKMRTAIVGRDKLVFYGFENFEIRDGVASVYIRPGNERLAKHSSAAVGTSIYEDRNADGELNAADAFGAPETGVVTAEHVLGAAAARMLADQGDARTFFHSDNLRSIVSATDEGGEIVGRRAYNATGVLRHETGHVDVYGFTGQEHNAFTGLIQFKMRDFDPQLARWASFDPAFIRLSAGAMNTFGEATTGYAYVGNNFTNTIDPNGLSGKGEGKSKENAKSKDNKNPKQAGAASNENKDTSLTPGGPQNSDQEMMQVIGDDQANLAMNMSSMFSTDSGTTSSSQPNPLVSGASSAQASGQVGVNAGSQPNIGGDSGISGPTNVVKNPGSTQSNVSSELAAAPSGTSNITVTAEGEDSGKKRKTVKKVAAFVGFIGFMAGAVLAWDAADQIPGGEGVGGMAPTNLFK